MFLNLKEHITVQYAVDAS